MMSYYGGGHMWGYAWGGLVWLLGAFTWLVWLGVGVLLLVWLWRQLKK